MTCRCVACADPHGYYCPDCGPDDEVRCDGSRKPPLLAAEDVAFFASTGYVPPHAAADAGRAADAPGALSLISLAFGFGVTDLPGDHDATPELDVFRREYDDDDNAWWRISCGHHLNLFDDALDRIDRYERVLRRLASEDYRGNEPESRRIAREVLEGVRHV